MVVGGRGSLVWAHEKSWTMALSMVRLVGLFWTMVVLIVPPTPTMAMYADEIGTVDFGVRTAGHGSTPMYAAFASYDRLVTRSVHYVAARDLRGEVVWRVKGRFDATSVSSTTVTTLYPAEGILRKWNVTSGDLMSDVVVGMLSETARIVTSSDGAVVAVVETNKVTLVDSDETVTVVTADTVLAEAKVKRNEGATVLDVAFVDGNLNILVGTVKAGVTSFKVMAKATTTATSTQITAVPVSSDSSTGLAAGTVRLIPSGGLVAASVTGNSVLVMDGDLRTVPVPADSILTDKNTHIDDDPLVFETTKGPVRLNADMTSLMPLSLSPIVASATVDLACQAGMTTVTANAAGKIEGPNDSTFDFMLSEREQIVGLAATSFCTSSQAKYHVYMSTSFGKTAMVLLSETGGTVLWTQEEGLGSIDSTVFLEEAEQDEIAPAAVLSWKDRLVSQYGALKRVVVGSLGGVSGREDNGRHHKFGFDKVAVLLSTKTHSLFGLDTMIRKKATTVTNETIQLQHPQLLWSVRLNPDATSHHLVHGSMGSASGVGGPTASTGGPSTEVLVLSYVSGSYEYNCVDASGNVLSSGRLDSPVAAVTILPVIGNSAECRQSAALVYASGTVAYVGGGSAAAVESSHGAFTHTVDRDTGVFRSLRFTSAGDSLEEVGTALFGASETIVGVHYPTHRGEITSSPVSVLGDDSLLLKYLNPHLVVVITSHTKKREDQEAVDPFVAALKSSSAAGSRKPLGVTDPKGPAAKKLSTPDEATTTLFVNLVDGVSARILHRVAHPNGSPNHPVPVCLHENWLIYSYHNLHTKRTELSVWTLHEGMVDAGGITATRSRVDQAKAFSSFDSVRDPLVLQKTFVLGRPGGGVSALGVTQTARGIASRHVLVATAGSAQILQIDRRYLDPRRPQGEPRESEKKEGLLQYTPILPPFTEATSHLRTVADVSILQSAALGLESQSLLLAAGGPDVFVSRLAPSKGFDLLPESFSKAALCVVVAGLALAYVALVRLGRKTALAVEWS